MKKIKIAFQGEKGAYSHIACEELFKEAEMLSEQRQLRNVCPVSSTNSLQKCKWQRIDYNNPVTRQGDYISSTRVFNDLKLAQLQCECIRSQGGNCWGVMRRRQPPTEGRKSELVFPVFYGCGILYWEYHLVTSEKLRKSLYEWAIKKRMENWVMSYQTSDVKRQEQSTNRAWLCL